MGLYEDIINNKKKKQKQEENLFKEITSGKFKQREIVPKKELRDEDIMSPITKPVEETMSPITNIKLLEQNKNISDERYETKRKALVSQAKDKFDDNQSYKNVEIGKSSYNKNQLQKDTTNRNESRTYIRENLTEEQDERAKSRSAYETQKAILDYEGPSAGEILLSPIRGAKNMFNSNFREDLKLSTGERLDSYNDTMMRLNQSSDSDLYNLAYGIGSEIGKQTGVAVLNATGLPIGTAQYFSDIASDQYQEAKKLGYDDQKAMNYAVLSSGAEALFEKLLGGSKALFKTTSVGQKATEKMLGFIKNNALNKYASSFISEGFEEFLEEYLGEFTKQITLDGTIDTSKIFNKETTENAIKSFIIGGFTGAYTTGIQRGAQKLTSPSSLAYEDAIYNIESTNGKMSDYNKTILGNIAQAIEESGTKVSSKDLISTFKAYKNAQINDYQKSALDLFPNLDENSRVLYNNLINDTSNLIYQTGVPVKFDTNLDVVSEWNGNELILNPTLTDMPIKTLLLKELGNQLVDSDTKNNILDKLKKNGMYDTLKTTLEKQGVLANEIDNEIVSLELNSIFNDEKKLQEFEKTNKLAVNEIQNFVENLSESVNQNTKDAVYLKNLADNIRNIKLNENNLSGEQLSELETKNIEKIESEKEAIQEEKVQETNKSTKVEEKPLKTSKKGKKSTAKEQVKKTETTNEETELKETYKSNEKIPTNVKKGTYIEPTSPINQESKKGKKLVKRLESKNSFSKQFSKDYTKLVDKLHPIEELAEASGNKQLYPKFNNIGMSEGTAQYQIGTAQTDINGNAIKDSKSLNEVWKPVEDAKLVNEFNDYLAHRLNIERYSKVPVWDKSITPENSQEIVDEYEEKYPEFKKWAEDVYKYNDNQLQKMIDSGLAKENAREWLYSNYVTIARDLGPKTSPLIEGSKNIKTKSPIRKAKGGTQPILPMKDSMARQTILTEKAIASNIAGLELLNVLGGTVGEKTYLKSLTNEGENNALIKNQDGTYSYTVYKNGSPITMQITKELADAIMPTKPNEWEEMLPFKAIRGVSKLQRTLLTDKNPLFILTNFFKDIGDAPLNSKYGAGEFYLGYVEALSQMINKSSLWKQYVAKGGKENTYFDTKTGEVKQPKNVITKSLKGIVNFIENANQFVEQAPRFTEFLLTLQHGGTIDEAIYNSAEITTNFARGGEITKALNRNGMNFLNASVQGFDKQIRNFSKQPGAKAYVRLLSKAIILGVAPALLNHIILGDDDDYEELPDYVKDNYYLFKTSDNNFFRLPKGRVMSIFGTAARHTYEVAKGNEDVMSSLKDTGEQFINNVAPNNPLENNILSPLLSVKNNRSWNGSPIVSKRLESLPESEQYDEKTSEIAKGIANSWVGKLAKWSPKKIDYLLDQYTGAVGDYVLPMTTPYAESREDNFAKKLFLSPLKSKFSVNSTISNKYTSEFYDVKEKLEKDLKVAGNIEDSEETLFKSLQSKYLASVNEELAELYAEKREIQSDTSLKDSEKYEKSLSIQRRIDDLAKFALEDYKNAYVSNTYGTIGNKEFNIELNQGKLGWTKISDKEKKKQEEYSTKYDMTPEQYYSMDGLTKSTITGEDIYKYDEINKKLTAIRENTTNDKEETIDYISGLDLSLPQKAMYMRMYYKSFNDYNDDIINYVDSLDISYDDKKSILIKLGIWK